MMLKRLFLAWCVALLLLWDVCPFVPDASFFMRPRPLLAAQYLSLAYTKTAAGASPLLAHTSCVGSGCTTPSINTTGATIIVCWPIYYWTGTAGTCSDLYSNTWHTLTQYGSSAIDTGIQGSFAYGPTTGTADTFTCAGTYDACLVMIFNGTLAVSGVLDKQNGAVAASNVTYVSTGSITTTVSGDLIVSAWGSNFTSSSGITVDSGLTVVDTATNGSDEYGADAWYVQPSAGAIGPTWTVSGSAGKMVAAVASFKP